MPHLPMWCHSEKSKARGLAPANSPLVLSGDSPVPALHPCFSKHILFLLRPPWNPRLHRASSHWGIRRGTEAHEFSSANTSAVVPRLRCLHPPQGPKSHPGQPSAAPVPAAPSQATSTSQYACQRATERMLPYFP